ncbi:hypothetical protein MKZ38_006242 [Zalerion maritima]|uniref:Uncharacterized protein n=1 Tax=Zalerion maritima TaxID=339359 RepID=A0AAD5WNT9_9PEZI|nr:hypothetical protein MKZ38_006242 [Zalerion maritima]
MITYNFASALPPAIRTSLLPENGEDGDALPLRILTCGANELRNLSQPLHNHLVIGPISMYFNIPTDNQTAVSVHTIPIKMGLALWVFRAAALKCKDEFGDEIVPTSMEKWLDVSNIWNHTKIDIWHQDEPMTLMSPSTIIEDIMPTRKGPGYFDEWFYIMFRHFIIDKNPGIDIQMVLWIEVRKRLTTNLRSFLAKKIQQTIPNLYFPGIKNILPLNAIYMLDEMVSGKMIKHLTREKNRSTRDFRQVKALLERELAIRSGMEDSMKKIGITTKMA